MLTVTAATGCPPSEVAALGWRELTTLAELAAVHHPPRTHLE